MIEPNITAIRDYLLSLQEHICQQLEIIDSKEAFVEDAWERADGLAGGGRTRVLNNGNVIEQGGVNFSHVRGTSMPASATANRPDLAGRSFEAIGVSLVIHPRNPYAPTCHANVRFFIAEKEDEEPIWWFGGGYDLTPYYGFKEDVIHWHQTAKEACDPFGQSIYQKYKKWCDEYFYIPHRNCARGEGGVFYDQLNSGSWDADFSFTQDIGRSFNDIYPSLVRRHMNKQWTEEEREKLLYYRGLYAEFNLVYDRGTAFGLKTGGNVDAILMSLPPHAKWK